MKPITVFANLALSSGILRISSPSSVIDNHWLSGNDAAGYLNCQPTRPETESASKYSKEHPPGTTKPTVEFGTSYGARHNDAGDPDNC